jgi:PAS domain S-box-containing protein
LDAEGRIVTWYSGAERVYGYRKNEVIGQRLTFLRPTDEASRASSEETLNRAAAGGHFGSEGWHQRNGGAKFWANFMTVALRNEDGKLQGFAAVVRDFSDRQPRDEKLRRKRARGLPATPQSAIAGIASGEFDQIIEANDTFLDLVGYSREDLMAARLHWVDLTPPEYVLLDDLAHEESLRFGASAPFEKELIRKDGTRVPVLVATAVVKLTPFRWITFVTDLRERDRLENVEDDETEPKQVFEEIIGSSAAMRRVQRNVEVVAPTDANVLILGETGTERSWWRARSTG